MKFLILCLSLRLERDQPNYKNYEKIYFYKPYGARRECECPDGTSEVDSRQCG